MREYPESVKIPLERILAICDPRKRWPWDCLVPDENHLVNLFQQAEMIKMPVNRNDSPELHIGRIRYLAKYGWDDPIEIDVGVPALGYWGPLWPVVDGNHRLWAAILRRDKYMLISITGQINHAAKLFKIQEF